MAQIKLKRIPNYEVWGCNQCFLSWNSIKNFETEQRMIGERISEKMMIKLKDLCRTCKKDSHFEKIPSLSEAKKKYYVYAEESKYFGGLIEAVTDYIEALECEIGGRNE